ncbi:MAG: bifunctional hydroxymethylpyrimidine kinase/phosphomethylpyrimidine kinase [Rhodobacteraceae bacterium]|nr:bifunctional hydroxymethylpyrimidine kinase/phosphomethylpyrimidine kinase [Paracoccaceae bacterium]
MVRPGPSGGILSPVILTAGSLHHDVIVTAPHLPAPDETVTGSAVRYAFGGKGGNQAVAAARMGAVSHMAGAVGTDAAAGVLLAALDAAGVDRAGVVQVPGASGMSVAIVEAGGSYGAVIVSAANLAFDPAGVVFPPGCFAIVLQNEIPEAANLVLARRARAAGLRVILNAAPVRAGSAALLALCDLVVVNRVEAAALAGSATAPDRAVAALRALGAGAVLVTLGGEGLLGEGFAQPAFAVPVISTHGAGDCFVGALAAEWGRGAALPEAARFAQAAAALHVAALPDARAGVTEAAVRALLARGLA